MKIECLRCGKKVSPATDGTIGCPYCGLVWAKEYGRVVYWDNFGLSEMKLVPEGCFVVLNRKEL